MIHIVFYIAYFYAALSAAYLLFFSLAGRFLQRKSLPAFPRPPRRIALCYPVYREDEVILGSVRSTLNQAYPREAYDVFVIADSLQKSTLEELRRIGCIVIPFSDAKRTKAKALNYALRSISPSSFDIAVVLDADNVVDDQFLPRLNERFGDGMLVAQCQRTAKTTDNHFALLDAVSEGINNHIFRKGHRAAGLSSGLIGSGMIFDLHFLIDVMKEVDVINGFDKDLEFRIFRRGVKIEYLEDLLVYDEKVSHRRVFQHQRTRWLASQWNYLKKSLRLSSFVGASWDLRDKSVQMMMPPRVLLLGGIFSLFLFSYGVEVGPSTVLWGVCMGVAVVALAVAVPRRFWTIRLVKAAMLIPQAILSMLLAILDLRSAQRRFFHTSHTPASQTTLG